MKDSHSDNDCSYHALRCNHRHTHIIYVHAHMPIYTYAHTGLGPILLLSLVILACRKGHVCFQIQNSQRYMEKKKRSERFELNFETLNPDEKYSVHTMWISLYGAIHITHHTISKHIKLGRKKNNVENKTKKKKNKIARRYNIEFVFARYIYIICLYPAVFCSLLLERTCVSFF